MSYIFIITQVRNYNKFKKIHDSPLEHRQKQFDVKSCLFKPIYQDTKKNVVIFHLNDS